jgi:hypothetical protein
MIVMAITGALFVSAVYMLSGKQQRTQFQQGINDLNSQIQTTINEVQSGFFPPLPANYQCTTQQDIDGPPFIITPITDTNNSGTGANRNCLFLGKVMQFGEPSQGNTSVLTYTVIGRRFRVPYNGGAPAVDMTQAHPTAVLSPDLTTQYSLKWGVEITKVLSAAGPSAGSNAIGFYNGLGEFSNSWDTLSNTQGVYATVIDGVTAGSDKANTNSSIKSQVTQDFSGQVIICVQGGQDQKGQVIIGSNNNALTTHVVNGLGPC